MTRAPDSFVRAVQSIPAGSSKGRFGGRTYIATKSAFNAGKSLKLVAEELGGSDYVSLNLYLLEGGARLYPCEMSSDKVIDFVAGFALHQARE